MCGICGRLDFALERPFGDDATRAMAAVMRHRGPDDDGVFTRPGVALAMRRLSIIDLAGGHQPIGNEDGSVQVVFNGEIYNYRELRARLEARGHRFRTRSDTEVIAHLWEDHAEGAFAHLRGMFAIALWDERTRTLVLARDRIGIKPLYVAERPDGLDFASEIKVLLALPETPRGLDPSALAAYFMIGYVPPPETAWAGIRELPPGHWLRWSPGRSPEQAPFWTLRFAPDEGPSEAEWVERLDAAVADAVRSHLVSDVPLAAFLSGGLDSGAVLSYMAQAMDTPPRAYTVRYHGRVGDVADETPLAAAVASRYGAEHVVVDVRPDVVRVLDDIVHALDQPLADTSALPTYLLTQAVARDVKVALSGLGGDELFGGYERHAGLMLAGRLGWVPAAMAPLLGRAARTGFALGGRSGLAADRAERFLRSVHLAPAAQYLGFVTRLRAGELASLLGPAADGALDEAALVARLTRHFGTDPAASLLDRGLAMDYGQYLPGDILPLTDRLSMRHSLEVRVPLVDHELVELAARIPARFKVQGGRKKVIFRRLLERRLPPALFAAPKQGFVSPVASWLRHELKDALQDALASRAVRESGWLVPATAERMAREHLTGTSDRHAVALWSILMFARWHDLRVPAAAAAGR
jgi:asparagine synthase (glutamine-hydrolysing)